MIKKLSTVAWHGISLKVPADWSLVGVSGDEKKGYFRVDSPVASTLEVRWQAVMEKSPDLMVRARQFLSELERGCRKKKIRFTSKLKQDKDAGNNVRFNWQSDRLGQGRLLYCEECDRIIIAQIVSARDDNVSHVAPVILDSIRDHRGDGLVDWALYGLEFAVPKGYRIEKQTLMSGYLSLEFKERAKRLFVERWGLAETLTSKDSLEQWYRKDACPDIKGFKFELASETVRGHEGLKLTGRRAGVKMAAKALASSMTLHPHPGLMTGYAWHCADSNRLFSVRASHLPGDDIAELIRDLITCHE